LFEGVFSSIGAGHLTRLLNEGSVFGNLSGTLLKPNVDIKESKKTYTITVEVPGVEENDITLELTNGALTISGDKKHEKEEKDEHYHSVQRSYGFFKRVLSLPEDVNEDGIEAKFKNGVLTITLPRKEIVKPKDETKVINIQKAA
jgi:HSP20 family protein